ncbi:MAG: FAD-dependent thymidylate synthase [Candidatus Methanosuratincola sp.]|nr:FAD-dependent thymidylate synthase [Candidatus Methanosuratincola sp.]
MKVTLLTYTPDPERAAAAAARQCYSKFSATKAYGELTQEEIKRLLRKIISSGHLSVLEHDSFTFVVEGISRACSHQLVRHRIASYSQQSQRYVKFDELEFIIPDSILNDEESKRMFLEGLEGCKETYRRLLAKGIPAEDARYILPQASPTKIVLTMNARSLLNFFELRCCLSAQWEIRRVAEEMLALVKGVAPTIFENAGPFCVSRRICPEKKYTCPKWTELYKKGCGGAPA